MNNDSLHSSSSNPLDPKANTAATVGSAAAGTAALGGSGYAGSASTADTSLGNRDRIDQSAERVKQATSNAVAGTKDAVDRAADRVEGGVHRATDKAADAAHRASSKAADLAERSRQLREQSMDSAEVWLDQAREYVREKPTQSVLIAMGAGWLLGRIMRR